VTARLGAGLCTNQPNETTQEEQTTDGEQYRPVVQHFYRLSDDDNNSTQEQDDSDYLIHGMSHVERRGERWRRATSA
jgi:hypothetical protein